MAAEQRHGGAAVFGDGDHRRLGALVGEAGRQGADDNAGGADAYDGHALGEQAAQVGDGLGEGLVGALGAPGQAVHAGRGKDGGEAARQFQPARAERDQRGAGRHLGLAPHRLAASAPTRTIEK